MGYKPEHAERVVSHLKAKKSAYALPAELALRCGLCEDEIAGLKGENIDVEKNCSISLEKVVVISQCLFLKIYSAS